MNIEGKDGFLVVNLEGELDETTCSHLKKTIDFAYKDKGMKNLIFDFNNVSSASKDVVSMVLGRYKRVAENSGKVYITGAKGNVDETFKASDVYKLIKIVDSVNNIAV